jgi:Ca2+-binding EF-hand superfamily protein
MRRNAEVRFWWRGSTELRSSSSCSASLSAEQIKGQFVALDSNSDGRLCRHDLLKAFGWDNQQQQAEQLAARGAQVDDLLEILNTGEEVRVNGSRSIGAGEFEAWLSRAT